MQENTDQKLGEPGDLSAVIAAYAGGDDTAADKICAELRGPIRISIRTFLTPDSPDLDDVIQETLIATLAYIRKNDGFQGDLRRLAVTIGNNRCRDILRWCKRRHHVPLEPLANWIADRSQSPLDEIADREMASILKGVLLNVGVRCRELLRDLYIRGLSAEEIRAKAGLKSIQAVYYRRTACLRGARKLLNRRLCGRSQGGGDEVHPLDADPEAARD